MSFLPKLFSYCTRLTYIWCLSVVIVEVNFRMALPIFSLKRIFFSLFPSQAHSKKATVAVWSLSSQSLSVVLEFSESESTIKSMLKSSWDTVLEEHYSHFPNIHFQYLPMWTIHPAHLWLLEAGFLDKAFCLIHSPQKSILADLPQARPLRNLFIKTLREKCPNTEFFLVCIWTLFTQWRCTLCVSSKHHKAV